MSGSGAGRAGDLDMTWKIHEFDELMGDPAYFIANGRTVTVDVDAEPAVVRRVVDFLSGLVYVRGGSLERVGATTFRATGQVNRQASDGSG